MTIRFCSTNAFRYSTIQFERDFSHSIPIRLARVVLGEMSFVRLSTTTLAIASNEFHSTPLLHTAILSLVFVLVSVIGYMLSWISCIERGQKKKKPIVRRKWKRKPNWTIRTIHWYRKRNQSWCILWQFSCELFDFRRNRATISFIRYVLFSKVLAFGPFSRTMFNVRKLECYKYTCI